MPTLPLNSQALPYLDPMQPIVVHFIIAMVLFSFFCDSVGYFAHKPRFFEVSFWNLVVAAIAIFIAILFGQFEAGLANSYPASQSILNIHTIWIHEELSEPNSKLLKQAATVAGVVGGIAVGTIAARKLLNTLSQDAREQV